MVVVVASTTTAAAKILKKIKKINGRVTIIHVCVKKAYKLEEPDYVIDISECFCSKGI